MAVNDDIDVEAMLEEAFQQHSVEKGAGKDDDFRDGRRENRHGSRDNLSRRRRSSRDGLADDDRRRTRKRSSSPRDGRRRRDRSYDRRRDQEGRRRYRSRSNDRHGRVQGRSNSARRRGLDNQGSPPVRPRQQSPELTPEERDIRTVFCMQLSARIRPRDLEEFFGEVGRVKDVRLITDPRTKKSKGVAYVEFKEVESVQMAITMSGRQLLGVPIIVKPSNAEKNRQANPPLTPANLPNANVYGGGMSSSSASSYNPYGYTGMVSSGSGPMKLYVGSLHFNITESMLREIFEPFGRIDAINLMRDAETNRSRGYAFITFARTEDAKRALEQMNGFELAGRSMKVGHVTEKSSSDANLSSNLDSDELDQRGINLGATGRLALMAKLADGSGLQMPQVALNALNYTGASLIASPSGGTQQARPLAVDPVSVAAGVVVGGNQVGTQCFMLSNMFEPGRQFTAQMQHEVRDDVIDECNKYGGLVHIHVDAKSAQGNVYVKCPSIATAVSCVNSLHGRFFSGRLVQGNYIPLLNYHQFFPDAIGVTQLLATKRNGTG